MDWTGQYEGYDLDIKEGDITEQQAKNMGITLCNGRYGFDCEEYDVCCRYICYAAFLLYKFKSFLF